MNSVVAVSPKPEITDKCKFVKLNSEDHKAEVKIQAGEKEVYIKHLKDDKFIWVGSFKKIYERDKPYDKATEYFDVISQSELGAEIEQVIGIDTTNTDVSGSIILADKGRKLFYA